MRLLISLTCLLATVLTSHGKPRKRTLFKKEQVIFSSGFNITNLMVPFESSKYIPAEAADIPSIFFTIADPNLEGGSCIYVLEGFAAYEILEGGRDTTTGYGEDTTVYFGSYKGVYRYISESLAAKKFGPFIDDIVQIQKAKDADIIYFLTSDHRLYKLENRGTMRTRVEAVICAVEFVLDTSNNIYYLACEDLMPRILRNDGSTLGIVTSLVDLEFGNIKLIRPAFIMEDSIPFFGGNSLYFLYSNGTSEKKDFHLDEIPSAFSVDASLYIVAAMNGKIYEFNVMDMILGSMFGYSSDWPVDIAKIVMAFIETTKRQIGYINKIL